MTTEVREPLEVAYDTRPEQAALDHLWLHTTGWQEMVERKALRVFERGEGIYLYDVHGTRYIDAMAGLIVVNIGHGRAEIAEAAAEQIKKVAYVSSAPYTTVPAATLSERVAELTPGDLGRVFFCSGGSEAIESALKIAKQVQFLRGFPRRYKVIARRGGYHGATFGAMSVGSNRAELEPLFGPFMPGVFHVPTPDHYRNEFGLDGAEGDLACARALEREIVFQNPETVAAFVAEPISTAAGCHVPAVEYWQEVRRICDRHGVLLIMDEVIDGWGRTGKLFAAEHFGVVPDILTMAKGLSSGYAPIAAAVCRDALYEPFKEADRRIAHLLTFGGHAVSCAIALKNIEIMLRERLVENSAAVGEHLLAGMRRLVDAHPCAGDARGQGLMVALDLVKSKETRERWPRESAFTRRLGEELLKRGLIVRILGDLVIAPPLVATREQVDENLTIVDDSLSAAERDLARG